MSAAAVAYPGFGWRDLARCFDATPRQLQILDEHGIVRPQQISHKRIWTQREAVLVGIALEMRRKHCNGEKLAKAIRSLSRETAWFPAYLIVTRRGAVRLAHNEIQVVQIVTREKEPVSVIDTRQVANRLRTI